MRESARLRPSVTGYTAAECPAQAGNAFRRSVPGRRIDNICLEDISLHRELTLRRTRRNCNEVSLQTHTLFIAFRVHEPEKCFRSGAAAFSRFVYPATHGRGLYRPPHRYRSNCKGLYRPPHRYRSNCKGLSDLGTGTGLTAKVFQTSARVPVRLQKSFRPPHGYRSDCMGEDCYAVLVTLKFKKHPKGKFKEHP